MKTCLFLFPALGLVVGCGGSKEPAAATAAKLPATKTPSAAMPALTPVNAGAVPDPGASQAAAPPAVDLATAMRPLDANGNPISDLDLLNQAIIQYGGRALVGGDIPTAQGVQGVDAINAALAARPAPPQLKDLSDLVKAGLIKALPVPPPGKAYVLDPKTRMAVLVNNK